jgi:hypothetical protein
MLGENELERSVLCIASFGGADTSPWASLIYPSISTAPMPHVDLPSECKDIYMEARTIESHSPRAAAALLRLVVEKLCQDLGGDPSKSIYQNIKTMSEKGLPPRVEESLQIVRIIGNESVHPGSINLQEKPETVTLLFQLINIIVQRMITDNETIDKALEGLPPGKHQNMISKTPTKL